MSGFGTREAASAIALAGERAGAFRRDVDELPAAGMLSAEERARYRVPLPRRARAWRRRSSTSRARCCRARTRTRIRARSRSSTARASRRESRPLSAAPALDSNPGRRRARPPRSRTWPGAGSRSLVGFPAGGGHFTSGGTHANMTGLACARGRALPARASRASGTRLGRPSTRPSRRTTRSAAPAICSASGGVRCARSAATTRSGYGPTSSPARSRPIAQPA